MIRALVPVVFALSLAVVAGILLAQNGVLSGSAPDMSNVSAASAGGGCCGGAGADVNQAALALAESPCCSQGVEASCCGQMACESGGCPFAHANGETTECSAETKTCCGSAEACSEAKSCCKSGEQCSADGAGCCEESKKCCSDGDECCSEEETVEPAVADDAVAAVTE